MLNGRFLGNACTEHRTEVVLEQSGNFPCSPPRVYVTKRHMGGVQSSDPEVSTNYEPAEAIDPLKITDFRRTVKLFNALMDSDAERNAELLAET